MTITPQAGPSQTDQTDHRTVGPSLTNLCCRSLRVSSGHRLANVNHLLQIYDPEPGMETPTNQVDVGHFPPDISPLQFPLRTFPLHIPVASIKQSIS